MIQPIYLHDDYFLSSSFSMILSELFSLEFIRALFIIEKLLG